MRTALLVLCCLFGTRPTIAAAQGPLPPAPRYVILDQQVRDTLAADWDAHLADPAILERAYCLTYQRDVWVIPEWIWRVTKVRPADEVKGATPSGIATFRCQPGETTAHVHPAQTCLSDSDCINGGALAYQCFPSPIDLDFLQRSGQPFALVICDRNAYVPYWAR